MYILIENPATSDIIVPSNDYFVSINTEFLDKVITISGFTTNEILLNSFIKTDTSDILKLSIGYLPTNYIISYNIKIAYCELNETEIEKSLTIKFNIVR